MNLLPVTNDTGPEHGPSVEHIARFQALQAGQYWRALEALPHEGIEAGSVLLIQSIRLVDDQPHTVILRPHPLNIGRRVELDLVDEHGEPKKQWFRYGEHRFLLVDFMNAFAFEPDFQAIRSAEIQQVQDKIQALQREMMTTQASPELMTLMISQELRTQAASSSAQADAEGDGAAGQPPAVSNGSSLVAAIDSPPDPAIVAMATGTIGDAISGGVTIEKIAALKNALSREHQIATIKANWIKAKSGEITSAIGQLAPYFEEHGAAALAHTEETRVYVKELLAGIASLDLYVGKDVEVTTVREGAGAPKDVPLSFVQRKLVMDEELSAWADVDAGFDFDSESEFFDVLREHDGLVEQIFPTKRCVLVMAVTRRYIDYGDKHVNDARNKENAKVFLMVRDGMNIHRVFSPVESHLGSARLFPTQEDQDQVFTGLDGSRIKFEDVAYTNHLDRHERFALHYKRFLLLACGLDHRLKLFGDFYDGPMSFRFVSLEFQQLHCRFLHDDDASTMLAGGNSRPDFRQWAKTMNDYLGSGSRVMCNWSDLLNPETAPGACRDANYGKGYELSARPLKKVECVIAYKAGDAICVDAEVRKDSHSSDRQFNCKVALTNLKRSHWAGEELPYLVLDAVDPEDLRWYIHHRGSRTNHLEFIRIFKRALKLIEANRAEESEARHRLAQALAEGDIGAPEDRQRLVDQAVIAWRAANRGKPLPKFEVGKASSAWTALLDQMFILAGAGAADSRRQEAEAMVRALGYEPLRLVLSGKAKLVVYAAPSEAECDNRLQPHAWVHRITLERAKTKMVEKSRRWSILAPLIASETTLHAWPDDHGWVGRSTVFHSKARKAQQLDFVERYREQLAPFAATMSHEAHKMQCDAWYEARERILMTSKYVEFPALAVPIGAMIADGALLFICVGSREAHAVLKRLSPSPERSAALRDAFKSCYRDPIKATRIFGAADGVGKRDWSLMYANADLSELAHAPYVHYELGVQLEMLSGSALSPLLGDWAARWASSRGANKAVWFAPGALDDAGRLTLDDLLGITLPADYAPVRVRIIELHESGLEGVKKWADICPGEKEVEPPHREKDSELTTLIKLSQPEGRRPVGYTTCGDTFANTAQARAYIRGLNGKVVESRELPNSPQPPEGYERWYFLPANEATVAS